ncbi:MAG: hypothetical protein KKH88_02795 [Nanoarchaeota archaeon]|nr:hypothetical protein [Nanoarchaeota archaeon]
MMSDESKIRLAGNPNLTQGDRVLTKIASGKVRRYDVNNPHLLSDRVNEGEIRKVLTDLRWVVTSLDYSLMESPAATTAYSNALSIPFNIKHPRAIPWYFRTAFRLATDKLRETGKSSHSKSWKEYVEFAFMEREKDGSLCYNRVTGEPVLKEVEKQELWRRWPIERISALAYPGSIEFMNALFEVNLGLEAIIATEDIEPIAKKAMHLMINFDDPAQAGERISFEAYGTANWAGGSGLMKAITDRMDLNPGNLLYIWDNKPEGWNVFDLKKRYGFDRVLGLRVVNPGKDSSSLSMSTDITVYKNFTSLREYFPERDMAG